MVALGGRDELLVGECKWGTVTARHLAKLKERAGQIARELGEVSETHFALFTGKGEADERVREEAEAGRVLLITGEEMLRGAHEESEVDTDPRIYGTGKVD